MKSFYLTSISHGKLQVADRVEAILRGKGDGLKVPYPHLNWP